MSVDGVAVGEHALCHALTDDGDKLGVGTVLVGKVSSREDRDTEYGEESRRDRSEATSWGFLSVRGLITLERELELQAGAGVTPGYDHPGGDALYTWQFADPPSGFLEEGERRIITGARSPWRDVDCQHPSHVEAGIRRLHGIECGEQRAGASQQHEGTRDLRRREDPQAAVRAGCHPQAATTQPMATRPIG